MSQFSVIRRYSDFVWLIYSCRETTKDTLSLHCQKKCRWAIYAFFHRNEATSIGTLPEPDCSHAVLRKSDHFKAFLEAKDDGLLTKKPQRSKKRAQNQKVFRVAV